VDFFKLQNNNFWKVGSQLVRIIDTEVNRSHLFFRRRILKIVRFFCTEAVDFDCFAVFFLELALFLLRHWLLFYFFSIFFSVQPAGNMAAQIYS
jgi:hypothetical protein